MPATNAYRARPSDARPTALPRRHSENGASWSERTPIATIERTATLIDRLSRRIEDAVATVTLTDSDGSAAPQRGSVVCALPTTAVPAAAGH